MTDDNNTPQTKPVNYDRVAKLITDPNHTSAKTFVKIVGYKDECANGVSSEFKRSAQRVAGGDLTGIEEALVSQAHLINAIVVDASKRYVAAHCYQAVQAYGTLALKAHATYRQTLLALSELKHPKAAAPMNAVQVNIDASGNKSANELLTDGAHATLDG